MLDSRLLPLRRRRASLRAMRPEDANGYASGAADPAVREYAHLPEPGYTEASVITLLQGEIHEGLERGDLAVLTIADPGTDAFAGSLVLFGASAGSVEVGFWVHPDHRGRGVASEALALAVEFARRSGFTRLTARSVPGNQASQLVLDRSGFVQDMPANGTAPSGRTVALVHHHREIGPLLPLPLKTGRLRLRLHEHADARALQRIYSRPDVTRYLLDDPWTEADAGRNVEERMAKTGLDGTSGALALVVEHEGTVVGDVQLWLTDTERGLAEIGWVVDPAHGGRGLATEAVRAVLELAFDRFGLHRVAAQMDARNAASARLAGRAGMQLEGHLRQDWWSKGEWTDTLVFGVLSTDSPAVDD